MQILAVLLVLSMALMMIEELVDLWLDAWRPQVTFRGLNLIASLHLSSTVRPSWADQGRVFSTDSTRYIVRSSTEIAFRGRTSLFHVSWPYRARVSADGANWYIELRASHLLWLRNGSLLVLWVLLVWGFLASDGAWVAIVPFLVGVAGYGFYRHWSAQQPRRALAMAQEIANGIQVRGGLATSDASSPSPLALE